MAWRARRLTSLRDPGRRRQCGRLGGGGHPHRCHQWTSPRTLRLFLLLLRTPMATTAPSNRCPPPSATTSTPSRTTWRGDDLRRDHRLHPRPTRSPRRLRHRAAPVIADPGPTGPDDGPLHKCRSSMVATGAAPAAHHAVSTPRILWLGFTDRAGAAACAISARTVRLCSSWTDRYLQLCVVDHGVELVDQRHEFTARHGVTGRLVLGPVGHPSQRLIDRQLMPAHVP